MSSARVPVLKKLNQVLSLFTPERTELSVLEVAELLGRPRSTVYRLLANIEREGFLDQDAVTGLYRVGIRLAALGELASHSTSLQRLVMPELRRLNSETGETATLMLLLGNEGITVDVVDSYQPLMTPGLLGRHNPIHASAGGKAFLTWLPQAQRDKLIVPPLKRYTPTTITDVRTLLKELEHSRRRGYTTVKGEFSPDVVGAAAPIWNHRDAMVATLTIGGPSTRVTSARLVSLGKAVIEACERISRMLGHRPSAAVGDGRGEERVSLKRSASKGAVAKERGKSRTTSRPAGRARRGGSAKRG
jgi:IclR family KDG regulon transcriptional repressor